jgi:Periplasmic binding protein-like domain
VPRDLSVVGYDDSTLIAFTDPPLTTVRQSVQAMGEAAVRALIDEIAGEPAPRAEYVFRPELVVRSSTGAVPHAPRPRVDLHAGTTAVPPHGAAARPEVYDTRAV